MHDKLRIVLVRTSHPGNIGAVARAMKNMGLSDLALVAPKIFPHADATARASGADDVLYHARVFDSLDAAVADCTLVAGASSRSRALDWPMLEPREFARRAAVESAAGKVAVVFGAEQSGLSNAELDRCQVLITIPANAEYASLNLAMAVQVLTYELNLAFRADDTSGDPGPAPEAADASHEELERFYGHLEIVLERIGFLDPENPRYLMRRLRRLFHKARPDANEVNILRGILTAVEKADKGR